jgi:hypothetical protein
MSTSFTSCGKVKWKGRPGYRLANDLIDLTALSCGGSIADLRFLETSGNPSENALWEAPWPLLDPDKYEGKKQNRRYGPHFVGKFLAGFTGHALCLDRFGAPSEEEISQGMCLHGEAGVSRWQTVEAKALSSEARLRMKVKVPSAGLDFERQLTICEGESVVYVNEMVLNRRPADQYIHWNQHVTFGPPLTRGGESSIAMSATKAMTWPLGYEGKAALANSREFLWPQAPADDGSSLDLSRPFSVEGKGFVAAVLTDPQRPIAFVAVLNRRLGLVAGYCFSRAVFPWVAVWEENCAREGPPWNGTTQARGMEFGTTPMPLGKEQIFRMGPLFETPTFCRIGAMGKLNAGYVMFLASVGSGWREIRDVQIGEKTLAIVGESGQRVEIAARKLRHTIK